MTVASAAFTESNILAQMYADLLKKAGFSVDLKKVESSEVFQKSLDNGTVAVVPEYAATYADSLQTIVTGTQNPTAANPSLSVTLAHLTSRRKARPDQPQAGPGGRPERVRGDQGVRDRSTT